MSLVLTKEYTERTLDLVKLKKWKFNNRKRDSKACQKPTQKLTQSFVSEDFYFGFWFWTKLIAFLVTCDQASFILRGGKVRLIQLLDYCLLLVQNLDFSLIGQETKGT